MESETALVLRRSGEMTPFNASDALAAVCDLYGHPIPRVLRARLGRAAKRLLEDGFEVNTVCAAMFTAVRRARPDLVDQFALEIQNAKTGQSLSWSEYRQALWTLEHSDPEHSAVYQALKGAFR